MTPDITKASRQFLNPTAWRHNISLYSPAPYPIHRSQFYLNVQVLIVTSRAFYRLYSSTVSSSSSTSTSSMSSSRTMSSSRDNSVSSLMSRYFLIPVPAGICLPMMTFSFRPISGSTLPLIAASVRTLVVSWKDAAACQRSFPAGTLYLRLPRCEPSSASGAR